MSYKKSKETEAMVMSWYKEQLSGREISIDRFSPADMVFELDGGDIICFECKARTGRYDFEYFTKNGIMVETSKLRRLNEMYGVTELHLVTVTSDGVLLTSDVNFDTKSEVKRCPATSSFGRREYVDKEVYNVRNFRVEGDLKKLLIA